MLGAVIKTYFAEKAGVNPENIYSVSIMPCTAKKFEGQRTGHDPPGTDRCGCSDDHPRICSDGQDFMELT